MWEVLARQIPFEGKLSFKSQWNLVVLMRMETTLMTLVFLPAEVTNPMQIMFSVMRGIRPDTSLESLPAEIPSRDTLLGLMTSGWTSNPDDRPSFLSKFQLG